MAKKNLKALVPTENPSQIFTHPQFGTLRTLQIDGEIWFVGKDAAVALGYTNPRKAIIDHVDREDKKDGVTIRDSIGRAQNPVIINESGLYSLVFASKLPAAKMFKRWVTSEVLPSIRKYGYFVTDSKQNDWREVREGGKIPRRILTDAIQNLIGYAAALGIKLAEGYTYGQITRMAHETAGLPDKGGRDSATKIQLFQLGTVENMLAAVINNGIAAGKTPGEIVADCSRQCELYRILSSGEVPLALRSGSNGEK